MPRKTSRKKPASLAFSIPTRAGNLRLDLRPSPAPRFGAFTSFTSAGTTPDDELPPLAEPRLIDEPWRRVSGGGGVDWWAFLERVRRLPSGVVFRHNLAGDLPGVRTAIDVTLFVGLLTAASHVRGFTFTRKPVLVPVEKGETLPGLPALGSVTYDEWRDRENNRDPIGLSNLESLFTTNLTATSLDEADRLAELSIGPVVAVLDPDRSRRGGGPAVGNSEPQKAQEGADAQGAELFPAEGAPARREGSLWTPGGRRVVTCPAELGEGSCATCGLCMLAAREEVVAFRRRAPGHEPAPMRQLTFGGDP